MKKDKIKEYTFTHDEIDLISECIHRTTEYYKGWLLVRKDWGHATEEELAIIKAKIRMLDDLQDRTTYIGQSEYYKNL